MEFESKYVSHTPDAKGHIQYSQAENRVWQTLYHEQLGIIPGRACAEFLRGLEQLELPNDRIPQLPEINRRLYDATGWRVSPVPALISARAFFELLATKHFPAATFIRSEEELHYVQEPDIFHEIFGHCPMLTDAVYANFLHAYAAKVLTYPETYWPLLQRLFWFTVEFGLINSNGGLRAYGGGILSSVSETPYSIESDEPMRVRFHPLVAFRTPYRIDRKQAIYFVIEDYEQLYRFVQEDFMPYMQRACALGEFPPFFPIEEQGNPSIHIRAC